MQLGGVLGLRPAPGGDERDRLADVADEVARKDRVARVGDDSSRTNRLPPPPAPKKTSP